MLSFIEIVLSIIFITTPPIATTNEAIMISSVSGCAGMEYCLNK